MVIPESRVHSLNLVIHTQRERVLLDSLHVGSVDIVSLQRKDMKRKIINVKSQISLNKVQLSLIVCKSNKILCISKVAFTHID